MPLSSINAKTKKIRREREREGVRDIKKCDRGRNRRERRRTERDEANERKIER